MSGAARHGAYYHGFGAGFAWQLPREHKQWTIRRHGRNMWPPSSSRESQRDRIGIAGYASGFTTQPFRKPVVSEVSSFSCSYSREALGGKGKKRQFPVSSGTPFSLFLPLSLPLLPLSACERTTFSFFLRSLCEHIISGLAVKEGEASDIQYAGQSAGHKSLSFSGLLSVQMLPYIVKRKARWVRDRAIISRLF